jgi:hypothetical protein
MTIRFLLQHIRRPVKPDETVPDSDWHTMTAHTSESAADKALGRAYGKMMERCGIKWDDSFRVTPAKDTVISFSFICKGYANPDQHEFTPCPDNAMEVTTVIWKSKTAKPPIVTSRPWYSQLQCENCNELERQCYENKNRAVS